MSRPSAVSCRSVGCGCTTWSRERRAKFAVIPGGMKKVPEQLQYFGDQSQPSS
ncbi:hypothetical protein NMG60_11021130 [Bertholletia excelsa]